MRKPLLLPSSLPWNRTPLWNGSLAVCLVEHHLGSAWRLPAPVTRTSGYAADQRAEPEWLVIPDSAQPSAWRLLHSASKGGTRFSVGHASRYPPGQAADVANKDKGIPI